MAETHPETIGRYRVERLLGRGAMGIVYKAVDPMIDREVAIKTIRLTLSEEELALYEARFAQEVKTVGKLNHAHIVTIYDVGRTDQFAYMAMEYIEGHELKAYLKAGVPTDPATAVDLVAQVADGLAFAHAKDIIHRDVKPSNVMVAVDDGRMVAKVMDFGIARAPSSTVRTMTGMILGSPRYMSPEQVIGRNVGPHSDVFSLGVVLYEMLAGEAPFDAEAVSSIMYQTVHVKEQPPSTKNPDIPPPLDLIVAKALAKDPAERYGSMREFLKALREAARTLPEPRVLDVVTTPGLATGAFPAAAGAAAMISLPPTPAATPQAAPAATIPPAAPAATIPPVAPATTIPPAPPAPAATIPPPGAPAATIPPVAAAPLATAFDSMAGTMRLAELTGNAGEVTAFFRTTPRLTPPPAKPVDAPAPKLTLGALAGHAKPPAPEPFPVLPAVLLGALAAVALGLAAMLAL